MPRLTVGIDPSTKKIAVVAVVDEPRVLLAKSYVLLKRSEKQDMASLGRAVDAVRDFIRWADQVAPTGERYAWVEDPLVGRGGVTTTMKQALVGGIIRGLLVDAGFEVRNVNVSTWKKQVVGNGRAQKPAIRQCVKLKWPKVMQQVGNDGDLVDAAAINLFAQGVLNQESALRRPASTTGSGVQGGVLRPVLRSTRVRASVRRSKRVL